MHAMAKTERYFTDSKMYKCLCYYHVMRRLGDEEPLLQSHVSYSPCSCFLLQLLHSYLCSCVLTGEENSENLTMVREAIKAYQVCLSRMVQLLCFQWRRILCYQANGLFIANHSNTLPRRAV